MKRRAILLGGGAVLATAAGGAVAWKLRLFGPHYPPTPYDDVLNRLDDARMGPQIRRPGNQDHAGGFGRCDGSAAAHPARRRHCNRLPRAMPGKAASPKLRAGWCRKAWR